MIEYLTRQKLLTVKDALHHKLPTGKFPILCHVKFSQQSDLTKCRPFRNAISQNAAFCISCYSFDMFENKKKILYWRIGNTKQKDQMLIKIVNLIYPVKIQQQIFYLFFSRRQNQLKKNWVMYIGRRLKMNL